MQPDIFVLMRCQAILEKIALLLTAPYEGYFSIHSICCDMATGGKLLKNINYAQPVRNINFQPFLNVTEIGITIHRKQTQIKECRLVKSNRTIFQ